MGKGQNCQTGGNRYLTRSKNNPFLDIQGGQPKAYPWRIAVYSVERHSMTVTYVCVSTLYAKGMYFDPPVPCHLFSITRLGQD